ncbi:MAG: LacI family DNA-binding transcriptional regulator [Dysgonamonadaceae bacterium]|nr:LacI family DNA-binding transcriptional regulator [Dysgonamonadaceae bacterium]
MKKKVVRIKDIARVLNISTATVSRALRDTHDVSTYTRKQVLEVASRLGYKANVHAAALASGNTKNIVVVIPFITNYYFSSVISGIQEVAYENGYNIVLMLTNDSSNRERYLMENLAVSNLDGLLVSISADTSNADYFNRLIDKGIPMVFFDRVPENLESSKVLQDDYSGAFMATDHLICKGYRRIAHLAGNEHLLITQNRLNGYKAALQKHRISLNHEWVLFSGFSQKSGEEDMEKIFKLKDQPNGIFAINDRRAVGAIIAIKRKGLTVGKDIGVIGFTNDPISTIIEPSLTTIEEPAFEIGKISCELLIKHINNSNFLPKQIVLSGSLIERESTQRS